MSLAPQFTLVTDIKLAQIIAQIIDYKFPSGCAIVICYTQHHLQHTVVTMPSYVLSKMTLSFLKWNISGICAYFYCCCCFKYAQILKTTSLMFSKRKELINKWQQHFQILPLMNLGFLLMKVWQGSYYLSFCSTRNHPQKQTDFPFSIDSK